MAARCGTKRRCEAEVDPKLAPFGGFLRARGVEGIACASLLQVLAIFAVIPAPSRVVQFLKDQWAHVERYVGNIKQNQILTSAYQERDDDDLIEAICRMRGIMLLVHPLNTGAPVKIYGQSRLVFEAAESNGTYAAIRLPTNTQLIPTAPKRQKTLTMQTPTFDFSHITNAADLPGPSTRPDITPIITANTNNINDNIIDNVTPVTTPHQRSPLTIPQIIITSPSTATNESHDDSSSTNVSTNLATHCPYSLRNPRRNQTNELTATRRPQEFRATNLVSLNPGLSAELAEPLTAPYIINNHQVFCQLEGCSRRATPFATVAAWKIHVRRAACHATNNLCTWCGHRVIVPSNLSVRQLTIRMEAHRTERCPSAPKKIMGARKETIERLRELGRDHSHIALPGAAADARVGKRRHSL